MSFITSRKEFKKGDQNISLEMIIMMQKDEPNQRSCIYKLKASSTQSIKAEEQRNIVEKYFQIRVKSTEFMQKRAIAIYFYNFTPQLDSFSKRLKEKNSNLRVQSMANNVLQ